MVHFFDRENTPEQRKAIPIESVEILIRERGSSELRHAQIPPSKTNRPGGCRALLHDLKRTGLLKDTIILWMTEFGRMPSSQGGRGRDHNPYCFTSWLAGGGVKPGITFGQSDDFGYKPADRDNPTEVYDLHATILRLLGIDHTRLTVRHDGVDRRLTDVHGHVIRELMA